MYIFVLFWFNCVPGWLPASRPNSFARGKAENDNVNSFVTTRNNASFWKNRRESSQKIVSFFNIYLCCCPDAFFLSPLTKGGMGGINGGGCFALLLTCLFPFTLRRQMQPPKKHAVGSNTHKITLFPAKLPTNSFRKYPTPLLEPFTANPSWKPFIFKCCFYSNFNAIMC